MHERLNLAISLILGLLVSLPGPAGADSNEPAGQAVENSVVRALRFERILGRSGTGPGEFHRPRALAPTASGGLLVTDTGNNRVQCLDAAGEFLWEAGGMGTAEGRLRRPTGAALATGLEFLILDAGSRRIHQFHARGDYQGVILDFSRPDLVRKLGEVDPRGIAVDRTGNVLVTEREGDRLLVFSPSWELLYAIGGFGGGSESFEEPEGVIVAGERIYVADSENARVQVLDSLGRFLDTWPLPGGGRPLGLAVDAHGNLFVADAGEDRIVVFAPSGELVEAFGATGKGPGSFRGPAAVCVIGDRLVVADAENDRLASFLIDYGS
jgi:DNA-binding beta-propeller fold protein YncE